MDEVQKRSNSELVSHRLRMFASWVLRRISGPKRRLEKTYN
jgi:hypothetical protein